MPTEPSTAQASPEFSIIIPVYNEEKLAPGAAAELCQSLDQLGWNYELLLCENGSKDATARLVDELAAKNPRVRALHETEPNYGRALKHGILVARGTYVFCDEIDLCDVDFYQRALPILRARDADMVVGSKVSAGARDDRPFVRHMGTLVMSGLLRVGLGFKGTDTHGLKALRREPMLDVARACVVEENLFASEFVVRATRMGRTVKEIPIVIHEKRPPTVNLMRRVPKVLTDLAKLAWVIRVKNR